MTVSAAGSRGECPFCVLVAAGEPHRVVYRAGGVAVLTDVAPINRGHLLVIPVEHIPSLALLEPRLGGQMFVVAQRCAAALRASTLRCDGVNLFLNDGAAASQVVAHVHIHVLPRYAGDAFEPSPNERVEAEAADLLAVADEIRARIRDR
jgi:diadenosine tetraphosphate (Ap4A) HIT family hydrolase